jgi:phosphatidylglycerophosphatase A
MTLAAEQRRALLADPAGWIACGFGSGLVPFAPGTFGSAAALLPWLNTRAASRNTCWNISEKSEPTAATAAGVTASRRGHSRDPRIIPTANSIIKQFPN